MDTLDIVLALFWGCLWAAFLQFVRIGQWLAEKRTWVTVVIGVGVDLLIAWFVIDVESWVRVALIVAASGLGIIYRSIYNEHHERELGDRPRLPNKTLWSLDDVHDGLYVRMEQNLRAIEEMAHNMGSSDILAGCAMVQRDLEKVRRRVLDARRGEYTVTM